MMYGLHFMQTALMFFWRSQVAILQVRDVDDRLYSSLKEVARRENRSLSQEVISILEKYLSNPQGFTTNPTEDFLNLSKAWSDSRSPEEIIRDIEESRTRSVRFGENSVLFD